MKRNTSGRRKKQKRRPKAAPTYPVTTPKGRVVHFVDGVPEDIKGSHKSPKSRRSRSPK